MLVLLLLVVIATIHLICTSVSVNSAAQSLADRQNGASFLRDEELALDRYLLGGDSHQLNAIRETQKELRQQAGRVRPVNGLVDLEDSWYVNYAEALIHARQQLDLGEPLLTPDEKEMEFASQAGKFSLKTRFQVAKMIVKDKLDL